MSIEVGTQISCDEVKNLEQFHWKNQYGKAAWEREQVRLTRIVEIIEGIDERAQVNVVGFGAGSSEFIDKHPEEAGKPDLEVLLRADETVSIILVEVTGTETRRGADYWVRPDKLEYCKNHPEEDVWIVLHYKHPQELVIFIKPDGDTKHDAQEIVIRGSTEYYVIFDDNSPELRSQEEFSDYLVARIDEKE